MRTVYGAVSVAGMSTARSSRAPARSKSVAGSWPVLARIPRRRLLRLRRNGRIVSIVGALVIAAVTAVLVEREFPWPHLLGAVLIGMWVLAVTWTTKRRWLRWLQREFAGEVSAKLDAIRRAAPLN
jgi:hypothetical protein